MSVTYHVNGAVEPQEVADLLTASGFLRPLDDLSRVQRMLDNAGLLITARDGDYLAGYVRALTDFAFYCFVAELAVQPAYQRHGIGRELLRRVREEAGDGVNMVLVASEGADAYYPRLGWERVERAWRIRRAR